MHKILRTLSVAAFALVAVAGCKPTTVTSGGGPADPTAGEIASAPPVKLPPAMLASKDYRCKDNALVHIDWFNDGTTATFKAGKDGSPVSLTAPAAGQPYVGGDVTVTGTAEASAVTVAKGGKSQACDA